MATTCCKDKVKVNTHHRGAEARRAENGTSIGKPKGGKGRGPRAAR